VNRETDFAGLSFAFPLYLEKAGILVAEIVLHSEGRFDKSLSQKRSRLEMPHTKDAFGTSFNQHKY